MAASPPPLIRSTDFDPRTGTPVAVAPGIVRITAPNAGPFTFTGTNSFILGRERVVVLDPGPDDTAHLDALIAAIGGRTVEAILLTHSHKDHYALVPRLRAATGAPVWLGSAKRRSVFDIFGRKARTRLRPERTIANGERLALDGLDLLAVATPGHCPDHFAFAVEDTDTILCGDHVMGWSTTVVAAPQGDLGDYLSSLDRLIALPQTRYLPGHGGEIADGRAYAQGLKAHRQRRNDQVLAALRDGPKSLSDLVGTVYPDLKEALALAARRTLISHLRYLKAQGQVMLGGWPFEMRARLA